MPGRLLNAARCGGVAPSVSRELGSAPTASNARAAARSPFLTAQLSPPAWASSSRTRTAIANVMVARRRYGSAAAICLLLAEGQGGFDGCRAATRYHHERSGKRVIPEVGLQGDAFMST